MLKFLHTGDLHLGLEFTKVNFDSESAKERRIELWLTFERIIKKAIDENMDFLFIAGDLFEEKYFTIKDINRVKNTLSKAEEVQIIIAAGNHDTLNSKSLYNLTTWPENVHIFNSGGLESIDFADKNTCLYGYSWDKSENQIELFEDLRELDLSKNNILLIHGDLYSKDSKYLPLDKSQLLGFGFDYIALGHIHKPDIISNNMAYCGSPEPLDFGETDEHGIIIGNIESKITNIEFIPFSCRMFLEREVKIDETLGYMDIIEKIKLCDIEDNLSRNFYRITLKGIVSSEVEWDLKYITNSLSSDFYYLELIDNTTIDYDLDSLERENKDNIIGYFIEEMKKRDLDDKTNRQALYIGLETLMKGKVTI